MGLSTESQLVIICDTCGKMDTNAGQGRKYSIKVFRGDGWHIGKKVTCPECLKERRVAESTREVIPVVLPNGKYGWTK